MHPSVSRTRLRYVLVAALIAFAHLNARMPESGTSNAENESELIHPTGLGQSGGVIYLAEASKHRVLFRKKNDRRFQVLSDSSQLKEPSGIAVNGNFVYVADPGAHTVFQIDSTTHEIIPMLSQAFGIAPVALAFQQTYAFGEQRANAALALLILDRTSKRCFRVGVTDAGFTSPEPWGDKQFVNPSSMSTFQQLVMVTDAGAKTIFETQSPGQWNDVRRASPTQVPSNDKGQFFPTLSEPRSAQASGEIIYVIDNHALFAFLRGRDRLVPLMYRDQPLTDPQQFLLDSSDKNSVLISDNTPSGLVKWPLLIPTTVEVQASGDISTPLAALYDYLWNEGVLPTVAIRLPYTTPTGEQCESLSCVIERGRSLQPKTNVQIEETLCQINPSLCRKDRLTKVRSGEDVYLPDVPFESYLTVERVKADGKSSVREIIDKLIPDVTLRQSVEEKYVQDLNPEAPLSLASVPDKKQKLNLPAQHVRYYVSVRREEFQSWNSKLAQLIRQFSQLSVRPLGVYSLKGAQAEGQDLTVHPPSEIINAYLGVLNSIDYKSERASKYGRANDVPVLIAETSADCQHPAFFKSDAAEQAFDTPGCSSPESASDSIVLDWVETERRHGTCVSSIIGAKSALYGKSLADGSNLRLSASGTLDSSSLFQMYAEFHEFFVVNVSSVANDVAAASSWKALLDSPMSRYVLYVAASGNENKSLVAAQDYPALLAEDYPNVISVGALDKTGTYVWEDAAKSQGSNTGVKVEILAPGEAVPCATDVIEGKAVYSIAPGTSFAAPIVTAVGAILLEKGLSPIEVKARLLSTAIPLVKQRGGEPLARFGRLSVERALLNIGNFHLEYVQNGLPKQFEAKAPGGSSIVRYQSSSDPTLTWTPLSLQDVLSIDVMPNSSDVDKMFRLVFYDPSANDKIAIRENVRLTGCFPVDAKGSAEKFLIMFGNVCDQADRFDSNLWINDPSTIIAPRLGIAKF